LLTSYTKAPLIARKSARDRKMIMIWEKATRTQAMLACRRLARRMLLTTCVTGSFSGTDFCLIFAP
jgi:hypothetical protein